MADTAQVTELLRLSSQGNREAEARLMEVLRDELQRLAVACMRTERKDHTLQPTALVNEAYLRLLGQKGKDWKDRKHFLVVAAQVMRRVLIDYARARGSAKRAGHARRLTLDEAMAVTHDHWAEELLDLDAAMSRLAEFDPRQARIIELRFYGGLTETEIAEELGVSERTVKREWKVGRAWLYGELQQRGSKSGDS